ncbi:MAG: formate--tetrahydrofolate ligase, partial [Oscillospiraceae bacterium]
MKTDIEIAQQATLLPIQEIAQRAGIPGQKVALYGKYTAKSDHRLVRQWGEKPDGKIILVTAISPTPAGEGKTTTSIGLADALSRLGEKTILALREPSLGPVFGIKGGAAGGGYAQVVPMEEINLHFTGDLHAIGTANNLLAAMVDNHIFQGNELNIDPRRVTWKRCMDMNDRQLRFVADGLGGKANGTPREDGFDITVASEVMAIFCLATDLADLKERLARIVVGYTYADQPVTAGQVGAAGAMAALLKDAFDPNLVQTLEGTPALVHGGPFANIAHGCNSVIATRLAAKLADYMVTEAGFGADLGAEKFLDIKCRLSGLQPAAAVVVATVRALKHHGGCAKEELSVPSVPLLKAGAANLRRHIENMRSFGLPVVVAVNAFPTDSPEEHACLRQLCAEWGVPCALSEVFAKGGAGGEELARAVLAAAHGPVAPIFSYPDALPLVEKVAAVCRRIYRAKEVQFAPAAEKQMAQYQQMGYGTLPVCIAKTQYSFSDNPALLAAPEGFTVTVREVRLSAGAGFVVAVAGNIMTMPGLPKKPA